MLQRFLAESRIVCLVKFQIMEILNILKEFEMYKFYFLFKEFWFTFCLLQTGYHGSKPEQVKIFEDKPSKTRLSSLKGMVVIL